MKEKQLKANGKKKKMTTMIITVFMCVALLSATTYAWFKLTNSPSVSELTLQAGTEGNLKISKDNAEGSYTDQLNLSTIVPENACLKPLTSLNGKDFYKPIYSANGVVESIEASPIADLQSIANKKEVDGGYLVQVDFYLKAETGDTKDINVCLAGDGASSSFTKVEDNSTSEHGAASVRISFSTDSVTTVYQPNADTVLTNRDAAGQHSMTGWEDFDKTNIKQGANHKFYDGSSAYNQSISGTVIQMKTNTATHVTMNIWIEGADADCINDIAGNIMKTNIQFICTDLN